MKLKHLSIAVIAVAAVCNFISCSEKPNDVTLSHNTLDAGGTVLDATSNLGRVLFYDTHLSVNNAIACGSCHRQAYAFSDNVPVSQGFENKVGTRNALPLQNLSGMSILFWDGRDSLLNSMVFMPILNHVEMGMSSINALVDRVRNEPYYADLFSKAFGSPDVTAEGISIALSYFVEDIVTSNTRFDQYIRG